ncbi:hypothetical protein NQU36_29905, partial [Escherichia coli]
ATGSLSDVHSKWNFSLFFLTSAAIYAIIIAWLYVAGPRSTNPTVAFLSRGFRTVLNSGPLVLLGRNSIQVFTYHLL